MGMVVKTSLLAACLFLGVASLALAEVSEPKKMRKSPDVDKSTISGKVKLAPVSFRVNKVTFKEVENGGQRYLAASVEFNRKVKASSVVKGVNYRVLRQDGAFWVDAYPSSSTNVRVVDRLTSWVSTVPISAGRYKVHLRGTIQSFDGDSLDCNKDGKGEGGYLPPYESQVYTVRGFDLEEIDQGGIDRIKDLR